MRCQVVLCKEFTGVLIVRVVWDAIDGLVLIHNNEQFSKRMSGKPYLDPVGFPVGDVFKYDEALLAESQEKGIDPCPKLTPYNGGL